MATQARRKRDNCQRKVSTMLDQINKLIEGTTETSPSVSVIERKIATTRNSWDEFEESHNELLEHVNSDEEAKEYETYDEVFAAYVEAKEGMEELLDSRKAALVPTKSVSSIIADKSEDRNGLFQLIDESLDEIASTLAKDDFSASKEILDFQEKLVVEVEAKLTKSMSLTKELSEVDPDHSKDYKDAQDRKNLEVQKKSRDIRMTILGLSASLNASRASSSSEAADSPRSPPISHRTGAAYFQKVPFPKFNGTKRNYPSFRREWQETVANFYPEEFQLREIRRALPGYVVPDIKNMRMMVEVWEFLDAEFGQVMEITSELIDSLTQFQFSREAKTESQRFTELHRKWQEVYSDLTEIDKVKVLDHEPTLAKIGQKLPSNTSRGEYVKFRLNGKRNGKSELDIMTQFMSSERERQKAWERLETPAARTEPSDESRSKCFNCGNKGHRAVQCPTKKSDTRSGSGGMPTPKSGKSHANLKTAPKPCPACKEQHTFTNAQGEVLYRTRLSSCLNFTNMSPADRANLLQGVNGCALCLDWTGDHSRDNCTAKVRGKEFSPCSIPVNGSPCGKKHNSLLHGSTNKICNMVTRNCYNTEKKVLEPLSPPTNNEIGAAESDDLALLQVQWVDVEAEGENKGLVFWDSGSNVNLVRRKFAERAGWPGTQVVQHLQTTGRASEAWETTAYWIPLVNKKKEVTKVLAFEMEEITAPLSYVDVTSLLPLFTGTDLNIFEIRRPVGSVDMLIGIHHAGLFPVVEESVSNLRLLKSDFGTGRLLDGSHPLLVQGAGAVLQPEDVYMKTRSQTGQTVYLTKAQSTPKQVNRIARVAPFLECEEMGVGQPRRCGTCSNCSRCSVRSQEMTRREQEELGMIEKNLQVDSNTKTATFRYPVIKDLSILTDNRRQAIQMIKGLESRLIKKGEMADYNQELRGFVDRGVLRELSPKELEEWSGPVNYISHHGVEKPESVTTKLRVVSNSSLDNNNCGTSYNDCLPKGPNSLVPLLQALVSWRSYQHCCVWDLSKAYNVVHTFDEELHMRRLVWRWGETDKDWVTYGFTRMHFGDRPAMCGLEVAKHKTADLGTDIDPEAVVMIKRGYVDDGSGGGTKETVDRLMGNETEQDGSLQYDGTVAQIFSLGGFKLKVMVRDGETRQEIIDKLGGGVLGLPWRPAEDSIQFHLGVNLSAKKAKVRVGPELNLNTIHQLDQTVMTKRLLMSQVYTIYDPLGLMTPITIKFKMILQRLADPVIGWDSPLEGELETVTRMLLAEMVRCRDINFPRSIKPEGVCGGLELLGFWDGGQPASAAVVYARYQLLEPDSQGYTHTVRLLASKARVTPSTKTKTSGSDCEESTRVSTPRTEMRGLLLLSRLVTAILPGLSEKPERISLLGDSECTISAVESDQKVLQVWFSNRVAEVIDHMESWKRENILVDQLHHWPGGRNIADISTKGKGVLEDVDEESEWQLGPVETRMPRESWPASRNFRRDIPAEELRSPCYQTNAVRSNKSEVEIELSLFKFVDEVMEKYTSYPLVQAIIARWLKANSTGDRQDVETSPTVHYLRMAEQLMFMTAAVRTDEVVKLGKLEGLAPFWTNGQWMTRGRLGKGVHRVLGVDQLPVLVPNCRLAFLIMTKAHREDHKGAKVTLWRSRTKAWTWRGYRLASEVEKNCTWCKVKKAVLVEQRMGNLPEERIAVGTKPFTYICLDLMGPVMVRAMVNKRAFMKVWPILFVCQSTGALHIQVSHDYGMSAFLLQYDHFVALRDSPQKIVSNRGSQLTAAGSFVTWTDKEDPGRWDWEEAVNLGARQGTEWQFVPAGCQFRNGLAESRVKAIKSTLAHILASTLINSKPTLTYAQLCTLLARAATIVNDRPVGVRSLTEEEVVPLTPNQLILGRSTTTTRLAEKESETEEYVSCDKYQEELLTQWWNLWKVQSYHTFFPISDTRMPEDTKIYNQVMSAW